MIWSIEEEITWSVEVMKVTKKNEKKNEELENTSKVLVNR